MSTNMKLISLLAIIVVILVLPIYVLLEPDNQAHLIEEYRLDSVLTSADLYAENCVVCHGAQGEGIGNTPPLNTDALRSISGEDLFKIISRGRDNTLMAAWSLEEGGIFTSAQIEDLVTFTQFANWDYVESRVAELGLTPPPLIEFEVSQEMLASLSSLPSGEALGQGLIIFAENCAACHGVSGAGTVIAPSLDSPDLRAQPQEDTVNLVNIGVPGTLMAGWGNSLSPQDIDLVVNLIYRWPELIQAGIEFPEAQIASIPSSPEMIAAGDRLFQIACKSCHGADAFGSPMAPALNNQLFLTRVPDAAIYQIIAGGVPQTLMPAWGVRLTDQEIQSLVVYLRSLETTAPPIVPPLN